MALLVVGLFAAGISTAVFLRNTLIANVDTQVDALARTDVAGPLLEFETTSGVVTVTPAGSAPPTEFFVAVYGPPDGALLGLAGGRGGPAPAIPEVYSLDAAKANELQPQTIPAVDGTDEFRSAVAVQEYSNSGIFYTQLVAVPLASVNRTIGNYLGIYSILALLIVVISAVLTRFLVTLTFRSLGQVESTADAIAAGDFSQRMTDIESTRTEVGRLKTAINAMLNRVDAAISQRDGAVRQMRRFIGDASHELRTPLVTVRGYAELYRMGAITGDDDIAQAMDRIESEAKRMGVLVEDLLALARLDERRDVVITSVDLRPIARDAALDLRATATMRAVSVTDTTAQVVSTSVPIDADAPGDGGAGLASAGGVEGASSRQRGGPPTSANARVRASAGALSRLRRKPRPVPAATPPPPDELNAPVPLQHEPAAGGAAPIVLGDENRIRQVVTNLLGNARRFTAEDSPIDLRVGTDHHSGYGWIEVIDHGEGVPDQIKDKIFQRFWRADTSRARETGGTGLGLSIVASIVESLHGLVTVADTPGGGATFRVSFPLAHTREASEHLLVETQPLPRLDLSAHAAD